MAQMYIYRRKTDGHLEAISGICNARPDSDYDRFIISRAELADRNPNDIYGLVGDELVLKPAVAFIADKTEITADGVDQAAVTVEVSGIEPLPASIDVLLADGAGTSEYTIPLVDGQSQAYPVTASEPTELVIRVSDQATYNDGGGITITAVEA